MARAEKTGRKPADRGPMLAMSIDQFCASHGISKRFYFVLKRLGTGPDEMRVGRRVLISTEAAARWRTERETASAQDTAA